VTESGCALANVCAVQVSCLNDIFG